jgi:hypothetical protein
MIFFPHFLFSYRDVIYNENLMSIEELVNHHILFT